MILQTDVTIQQNEMSISVKSEDNSIGAEAGVGYEVRREVVNTDYNALENKPVLDGVEFKGYMEERDPTVPSWAKSKTRPVYTAADVGAVGVNDVEEMSIETMEQLWNMI